jgi:tetratricopeptide (TPR) repeat protein
MLKRIMRWINGAPVTTAPTEEHCRIAAAILSGGGREAWIGNAIASVLGFVDGVVFIRTDASADEAIRVGVEICEKHGLAHNVIEFPGPYIKTSAADGRNLCLSYAHELGYGAVVLIDTDEELRVHGVDVRKLIATSKRRVFETLSEGPLFPYPKDRFFKLPATGKFIGRLHEWYESDELRQTTLVTFWEQPKSREDADARSMQMLEQCDEWIADEPDNFRPRMYRAECLASLGDYAAARPAFIDASPFATSADERGWMYVRAGMCDARCGNLAASEWTAIQGMAYAPHMPELAWLCAFAHHQMNNWRNALSWANMAIALGPSTNLAIGMPARSGFGYPPALGYAPWGIRRDALRALAEVSEGEAADRMRAAADEADKICQEMKR